MIFFGGGGLRKGGKAPPVTDSQRSNSSASLFVEIHNYFPKHSWPFLKSLVPMGIVPISKSTRKGFFSIPVIWSPTYLLVSMCVIPANFRSCLILKYEKGSDVHT